MKRTEVVTAVVLHRGRVLYLRRSQKVGSYRGRWSCVSGHLESEDSSPEERALKELSEETGISPAHIDRLTYAGRQLVVDRDADREWVVHIVLCEMKESWAGEVHLDWENTEYMWSSSVPTDSVPALNETVSIALAHRKDMSTK